jgi:hypothetical protein
MKYIFFSILALFMLITSALNSAEIIPIWHNESGAGDIQDMEILKGHNEFLLLVGVGSEAQFQIRSTETGELINSEPVSTSIDSRITITPDSTRFIHLSGGTALVRNLQDNFKVEGFFDVKSDSIVYRFTDIALDPFRPLAYVTVYGRKGVNPNIITKSKVSIYNYETGEFVQDLTDLDDYEYSVIEVSDDGRYLAVLNEGKAYLKVWELETMKQIVSEKLFADIQDYWCDSRDIKFSKLNREHIYLSGTFTKELYKDKRHGTFLFDIINNKRSLFLPEEIYSSTNIELINNEKQIFISSNTRIGVLDLIKSNLEWYGKPPQFIFSEKIIYSLQSNFFIGFTNNNISKFLYDSETSIKETFEDEIIISPNPTNGSINISFTNQHSSNFQYEIVSTSGQIVQSGELGYLNIAANSVSLDISSIANSKYLLRVFSEREEFVFNVIKED